MSMTFSVFVKAHISSAKIKEEEDMFILARITRELNGRAVLSLEAFFYYAG